MMKEEIVGGIVGTSVSAVGTAAQTNDQLQTICLVITIIGGLLTIITTCVIPLIKWFINAKKDGKIDNEEAEEGKNLFLKLIDAIKNFFNKNNKGD